MSRVCVEDVMKRLATLLYSRGTSDNDFDRGYRTAIRDCQEVIKNEMIGGDGV